MRGLQSAFVFWVLTIVILAGGVWLLCPSGECRLTEFDRAGLTIAHSLGSDPLDQLMGSITQLGSLKVLLPAAGLGAWLLSWRGRPRDAAFIVLALLGSAALSHLVKLLVARPRPDLFTPLLPAMGDWSFPSAHAMQVTAAALAFFLIIRPRRWDVALLLGGTALLVGLSRIYLQVHFASDVIVGMFAAGFWTAGLYASMFRYPITGKAAPGRANTP